MGLGLGAGFRAGANMGSVPRETLTEVGTQKKRPSGFPTNLGPMGPGPHGPWAQTGLGPKWAQGPNGPGQMGQGQMGRAKWAAPNGPGQG